MRKREYEHFLDFLLFLLFLIEKLFFKISMCNIFQNIHRVYQYRIKIKQWLYILLIFYYLNLKLTSILSSYLFFVNTVSREVLNFFYHVAVSHSWITNGLPVVLKIPNFCLILQILSEESQISSLRLVGNSQSSDSDFVFTASGSDKWCNLAAFVHKTYISNPPFRVSDG